MAVVVPVVDHLVELRVELAVPDRVGKVQRLDLGLDRFQPGDVDFGRDAHEPAGQRGFKERLDLDDVADEVLVDRAARGRRGWAR